MKCFFKITISLLVVFLIDQSATAQYKDKDFNKVSKIFMQQEKDWNDGDIDAFMTSYWKSEQLQFGGSSGITRGWNATIARYKIVYPDKDAMGKLTFEIKDLTKHSRKVISLTGSWSLQRKTDAPGGHFLLIWRKIKGKWLIVADHTSALCSE